jgi:alpha/beta superfamily hydrolase
MRRASTAVASPEVPPARLAQAHPEAPRRRRRAGAAAALAVWWLAAGTALAATPTDYFRENRWAQEVVPGLVVGDAVYLATPTRPRVLAILAGPVGASKGGVVVVHGLGVHPDWGLIGGLRVSLADAGYTTLSVQMPVLPADAPRADYAATLPEAADRIAAAVAYLRSRGVARVALVSHSLGSAMADAYLARPDALPVDAWVPVGMMVAFSVPPKEPVLDVTAAKDFPEVDATAPLRRAKLPQDGCSRELVIPGTDHYFSRGLKELSTAIEAFLDRVVTGRCARS